SIDFDRGDRVLGLFKLLDDPDAVDDNSRLDIIKCPLDRGHILGLDASHKTDGGTPVQTRNRRPTAHARRNAAPPRQALDQLVTQQSRRAEDQRCPARRVPFPNATLASWAVPRHHLGGRVRMGPLASPIAGPYLPAGKCPVNPTVLETRFFQRSTVSSKE